MSDTPAVPTTPEPYGVPETIAHWRRQAELCDSNVESATFLHCADEIEEVLALAEARSTPAEALDVEWLRRDIEKIDHPCHDACIGNLHADCQCAAWIRQEVLLLLSPHNRETDHEPR